MIVGIALTVVLLIVALLRPQRMKPVLAGIMLVWVASAIWLYVDNVRSEKRLVNIIATASFDPTCADPEMPIRVTFDNRNNVAVEHLTYTLEGFEPAFRASVSLDAYQVSARRLEPAETFSACRAFRLRNNENADPAKLDWRVTINSAIFE